MTRYYKVTDGERIRPNMKKWRMRCCDCGLVHVMDFFVVRGQVELTAVRDKRATQATRKRKLSKRKQ